MSDSDARAVAAVQLCCCWSIGLMTVSASPPARGGWGGKRIPVLQIGCYTTCCWSTITAGCYTTCCWSIITATEIHISTPLAVVL